MIDRLIAIGIAPLLLLSLLLPAAAPSVLSAPPADRAVALGVSLIEGNTPDRTDDLPALDAFAARAGRMPASFSIWSDWGGATAAFPPRGLLDGLRDRGVRPVLFWQPTGPDWQEAPERYAYAAIVAGDWDRYLVDWAEDAAAWGGRVVVRFAHEMNAPWFPWAIGRAGNTPQGHRDAWRHVVELIRDIAPEVRFLWSPNTPCGRPCVDYGAIYPGDAWVDLLGLDAYAWDTDTRPAMVDLYGPGIRALRAVGDRPIVIAETGAAGPADGRDTWLRDGLRELLSTHPWVVGFLYFDIDMGFAGQPDWRLTMTDGTLAAWTTLARDPRFGGTLDRDPAADPALAPDPTPSDGPVRSTVVPLQARERVGAGAPRRLQHG